jgi:hypothetical protein
MAIGRCVATLRYRVARFVRSREAGVQRRLCSVRKENDMVCFGLVLQTGNMKSE